LPAVPGRGEVTLYMERHMNDALSTYFNEVQRHLDDIGQPAILTADERDIVDDYATQEFGAKECAERIAQARS
jgi:hypothetical protein